MYLRRIGIVRADRLVSLVLLLRQRGRMTADALAKELEVSTRTVLRDIEALSTAGIPVYTERGRHGGFALLPGFRTELTGLTNDEALAVLTAGSGGPEFGLGTALTSGMRKILDALPAAQRSTAHEGARRFLAEPETDLLSRPLASETVPSEVLGPIRRAVVAGRRLRVQYAIPGREPVWRTVDPLGLVRVRERLYLLAMRDGEDRTYRVSRMHAADVLDEPAERPDDVDLAALWQERSAQFLSDGHLPVSVRVAASHREQLFDSAVAVGAESPDEEGWLRVEVAFQDAEHAEWALWGLGVHAEALGPPSLRDALGARAATLAARYGNEGLAHSAEA